MGPNRTIASNQIVTGQGIAGVEQSTHRPDQRHCLGTLGGLRETQCGDLYGTNFDGGNLQKGMDDRFSEADSAVQLRHFTSGKVEGISPKDQMTVGADAARRGFPSPRHGALRRVGVLV